MKFFPIKIVIDIYIGVSVKDVSFSIIYAQIVIFLLQKKKKVNNFSFLCSAMLRPNVVSHQMITKVNYYLFFDFESIICVWCAVLPVHQI